MRVQSSGLPASGYPLPAIGSAHTSAAIVPGCHLFVLRHDQDLVDARTVEVDDLEAIAAPVEMLADLRNAAELRDQHAGGRVVFLVALARQRTEPEQFAQVVGGERAVYQPAAV